MRARAKLIPKFLQRTFVFGLDFGDLVPSFSPLPLLLSFRSGKNVLPAFALPHLLRAYSTTASEPSHCGRVRLFVTAGARQNKNDA